MREALLWCLALSSGCSFAVVNETPAVHEQLGDFDCTRSRAPAVIDTILAVVDGLGASVFLLAAMGTEPLNEQALLYGMAAASGGVAALFGWSAIHGYQSAGTCDDAMGALYMRQAAGRP